MICCASLGAVAAAAAADGAAQLDFPAEQRCDAKGKGGGGLRC